MGTKAIKDRIGDTFEKALFSKRLERIMEHEMDDDQRVIWETMLSSLVLAYFYRRDTKRAVEFVRDAGGPITHQGLKSCHNTLGVFTYFMASSVARGWRIANRADDAWQGWSATQREKSRKRRAERDKAREEAEAREAKERAERDLKATQPRWPKEGRFWYG